MRILLSLILATGLSLSAMAQQSTVTNTSFNAIARGAQVLLTWNPEKNTVVAYDLEKSKNGSEFVSFGKVEGTTKTVEFIETDFEPYQGLSYYRLKLTNADGSISYSNVVPVKYNEQGEAVNPVAVEQAARTASDQSLLVIVRNAKGEEFYSKVEIATAGNPVECTDPDPFLTVGTYTIIGCSDQNFYSKQMLVKQP